MQSNQIELFQEPIAPAKKPASIGNMRAVIFQRMVAGAVVIVPFLGLVYGLAHAWQHGFGHQEAILFVVSYSLGMLGITLGYHRYFAHKGFKTSKGFERFLLILGSCSAQGPLYFWVATHRRHHIHSDREGDPHSPNLCGDGLWNRVKGFWHGHIGWMFSNELTSWGHFVPDLLRDRSLFFWQRTYFLWVVVGLMLPTLVGFLWIGGSIGALKGFLWGGLIRIFFVNQALWLVGSISHLYGSHPYRNKTKDMSCNNFWVAFLAFGEGNQNNHHAFANSAKHGLEWWQPDFTYNFIVLLEKLGIIWDVKVPSRSLVVSHRDV